VLATSLALVAAVGLWLGTRAPVATTPAVAMRVPAARPTFEARGAAVEPVVEPVIEGPTSPGAALAVTSARAPSTEATSTPGPKTRPTHVAVEASPFDDTGAGEEAERVLRAQLEQRARSGGASRNELKQLRHVCARQRDRACYARVQALLDGRGFEL
jgi:hypothetical protein